MVAVLDEAELSIEVPVHGMDALRFDFHAVPRATNAKPNQSPSQP